MTFLTIKTMILPRSSLSLKLHNRPHEFDINDHKLYKLPNGHVTVNLHEKQEKNNFFLKV